MNLHRVIIRPQRAYVKSLKVLWKTYTLFPQVLWKTIRICEDLCCSNCVGSETYVWVRLTKLRGCDSLHAKITRSQRLFISIQRASKGHKLTKPTKESFNKAMFF